MSTPAIILIALYSVSLLQYAHDHGKPRANVNFWYALFSCALVVGLLIWGGFFQ
jgi:hypothetical protein